MKVDSKEGLADESRAPPKAAAVLGPSLGAQLQSFTATVATQLATATSAVTSMVADINGLVERLGEKKTANEERKSHIFLLLETQALRRSIRDMTNEQKSLGSDIRDLSHQLTAFNRASKAQSDAMMTALQAVTDVLRSGSQENYQPKDQRAHSRTAFRPKPYNKKRRTFEC